MLMQPIPISTAIASVLVSFGLAQASAEDLTVDDVLKMWSERQAELDAVEIHWIEKVSQGQNRSATTCSLSLGAGSCIRYKRESAANLKGQGNSLARPGLAISAFDGKRNASFTSSSGPSDHHRGIEFDAEVYDELPNYYLHPLLFYYRPLLVVPVAFSVEDHVATEPVELKLVERNAVLDGTTCLIVESVSIGPTPYVNRYWVDASKQGLILKHVASSGGSKKTEMRIKYNKDPEHGWIPTLWRGTFVGNSIDGVVTKQSIGRPLNEDESFAIAYPPGTVLFDQDRGQRYRVQEDGSMGPIEPAP